MSEELQNQIKKLNDQIKGLTAQLDAAKGMVNDGLNIQLQIRTNLQLFAQNNQELSQENHQLRTTVDTLTKQILDMKNEAQEALNAINP